MANGKNRVTVGAAVHKDVHAALRAHADANLTTISKTLAGVIAELVRPRMSSVSSHKTAMLTVEKMRGAVFKLGKQAPKTYPPTLALVASKVYNTLKDVRPSFLSGDPDGHFEREHGHLLATVARILAKAREDSAALSAAWVANERKARAEANTPN